MAGVSGAVRLRVRPCFLCTTHPPRARCAPNFWHATLPGAEGTSAPIYFSLRLARRCLQLFFLVRLALATAGLLKRRCRLDPLIFLQLSTSGLGYHQRGRCGAKRSFWAWLSPSAGIVIQTCTYLVQNLGISPELTC